MSYIAVMLLLVSAFLHATWNFLSKRAEGGIAFVWLFTAIGTVIYTPIVCIFLFLKPYTGENTSFVYVLGSIFLHLLYFVILQKGYTKSDFSLVYPVARGLGPMLVTIMAILLFNEQPSMLAFIGTGIIVGSVFFLTGGFTIFKDTKALSAIHYGLFLGMIIAAYTLWDKYVVSYLLIPPLLLDYLTTLGRFIVLTPVALQSWAGICYEWKTHRREAIGVGILNSLAYILVLSAMVLAPISYVAPIRELSILIGTIFGIYFLREGYGWKRIIAASTIVIGVTFVVIG
ncbi:MULTISPECIES: DMT family transporter [Aneurinibacillus]|uniref:DMT family transporter n=1 Tax=Aneurinibacillus thermoaerophilus TaxID=143495 RepID=A0A1G7YY48_ANETH|nr:MULTISPECIES: DMT family transporter [Aneurinibacillus]AMA73148.1 small multidrug resistance protein [Aneurinibacillus sp. XH2]MED0674433.1 DMT family transporter [Aneurinibacillus thermoaerophilus]MED0678450.1 DMT family transporter [Aneurinibacillus thermoaerophilus]MED0736026.1 DMT family transporter [Aneurinibacillus thermoaerophilus]MED0758942.1 DMT family transporter [Aneurinibacillus thermoaerophilus]